MTSRRKDRLLVYLWMALLSSNLVIGAPKELSRSKRNALQLGSMLECSTGRSMWDYNGYGCYCGLGGQGTPLDATDRCCQIHDGCYDQVSADGVCAIRIEEYTAFYRYTPCSFCADLASYKRWVYKFLVASPECRFRICECDSALARCAKRATATFNPAYRHHKKKTCKNLTPWFSLGEKDDVTNLRRQHNKAFQPGSRL